MIGVFKSLGFAVGLCMATQSYADELPGDPERGEKVYRKCKACHQVGPDAKDRTGPALIDIVGGPIAGRDGFAYSDALRVLGAAGTVWTSEALDIFLTKPRDFAPGTKMSFSGLRKPKDREDVIAFLASMTPVTEPAFSVSAEVLALPGDLEYGAYLSSECTTCHQISGANDGIPAINGLSRETFVTAMHAYREGHRTHQVMQMVSGRLGDEEIAALAAYFEAQE